VERISEFEDREHFPQPWIAEEEAQGAALGLLNAGIALDLFPSLAVVSSRGDVLDGNGLGLDFDGLGLLFRPPCLGNP
jgi:hypothetical protein